MSPDLKQLETFIAVADHGSFKKAAHHLNTTQPNISTRISKLEANLQIQLMERDAGSVRLTTQGIELLKYARDVINSLEQFVLAANQPSLFENTIRLGVTEMIVHTWLRDFLNELKNQYPNVLVELNVDVSFNIDRELGARNLDLAIQNGPFQTLASGTVAIDTYPLIWVASPQLALPIDKPVSKKELCSHPILTQTRNTQLYNEVVAHFSPFKESATRLVPSSSLAAQLQMTVDGMGVATMPEAMVSDELQNGQLQRVNYAWKPEALEFHARYDLERCSSVVRVAAQLACDVAENYSS